jgi:hypothetical protein
MAPLMFARLRPDRVTVNSALVQHIAPVDPVRPPRVVVAFCGLRLDADDLDPRCVDRWKGQPCVLCLNNTPTKLIRMLAHVTGTLPPDALATIAEPRIGTFVYVAGVADLGVRHILPARPLRGERLGRPVVLVECGHMGWCPVAGPYPTESPVCRECLDVVRKRHPLNCPAGELSLTP